MRIAILTDFLDFNSAYSLVSVVASQVAILERKGQSVKLIVSKDCVRNGEPRDQIRYCVPVYTPVAYESIHDLSDEHQAMAAVTAERLIDELPDVDVVFTHDWIFQHTKAPLAEALRLCADQTRHVRFFHWIHSTPFLKRDWYDMERYGANHRLVYLNESELGAAGEQFNSWATFVPNICDPRIVHDFSDQSWSIIDAMPALMNADVVQIYPAATDRLHDKGVMALVYLFAELKRQGQSVCCLIVDYWSGRREKEDVEPYMEVAQRNGLTSDEFRFISEITNDTRGISQRILTELWSLSNLFAFPSRGECGPLVLPEAVLSGGVLPVVNEQLPQMAERIGGYGLKAPFTRMLQTPRRPDYERVANDIIRGLEHDGFKAKTNVRTTLNMDTVYREYYEPLLEK